MSQENVEIVRRGWEHFEATGELLKDILAPDFVWVMSTFRAVMDFEDEYRGMAGVERFLEGWIEPFDQWQITFSNPLDATAFEQSQVRVEPEVAHRIGDGEVGDRVGEQLRPHQPVGEDVLLDPLQDGALQLARRHRRTGAEDDRVPHFGRVAAQVGDTRQDFQVVDAPRLPPFCGLHVDRGPVPRHLVGSARRR